MYFCSHCSGSVKPNVAIENSASRLRAASSTSFSLSQPKFKTSVPFE